MRRTLGAAALMLVAWLAINATWGLTGESDTVVSGYLGALLPLQGWVLTAVIVLGATLALARGFRSDGMALLAGMLLAYVIGEFLGRSALEAIRTPAGAPLAEPLDPLYWAFRRSFLLLPAVPMLAMAGYLEQRSILALRIGDLRAPLGAARRARPEQAQVSDSSSQASPPTWGTALRQWLLFVGLPMAVLWQFTVGFAPITSGRWFLFAVPLALLALLNGLTEELLFRGLLMPASIAATGVRAGLWLQAGLFAIHHWGASPGLIAGAPMAVVLLFVAVLFGRSVLGTGGLLWATIAHAALDFGQFGAQFVASG